MNLFKTISLSLFVGACAISANAQNPIINTQFGADPTAKVFGDSLYLYPSHDIPSPVDKLKEWFCMADYHVFSTADLVNWNDHGVIVDQKDVPWGDPNAYSMWAPDCIEHNGSYYFFFPDAPKGKRGFAIGVAKSKSPTGPFKVFKEPIKGIMGIDPCVLQDDDGQNYIYWGGMGLQVGKLSKDFKQLVGKPTPVKGLPEGFKEGPFAFKYNGKYYLTFPWVRVKDGTETLAYAMADSPMGPFEFKGIIMDESKTGCWTNHHSIVKFKGQWYLFYHHNDYSPDFDKCRSVRIDRISFNDDGTINKVIPTNRGVGITPANSKIQIDRGECQGNATIDYLDRKNPFLGWKAILPEKASISYDEVDMKDAGNNCRIRVKGKGVVLITIGGCKKRAEKTGTLPKFVTMTADVDAQEFTEVSVPIPETNRPQGHVSITLSTLYGQIEADWLEMK